MTIVLPSRRPEVVERRRANWAAMGPEVGRGKAGEKDRYEALHDCLTIPISPSSVR